MPHVPAGARPQFPILKMKAGAREGVEPARMIVVQVREDHVLDRGRLNAEPGERGGRCVQVVAGTGVSHLGRESCIDDDGAAGATDRPDEVVLRHRRLGRRAAQKILARHPVRLGRIAQRIDLVDRQRIGAASTPSRRAPGRWVRSRRDAVGDG